MQKSQKGFTLIELVVVIVLLGILGVTALARFQDISGDARAAAITGIASELAGASAINYAEGLLDGSYTVPLNVANICTTAILDGLFLTGNWPTGNPAFALNGTGDCTGGTGTSATCTIFQDTNTTSPGYDVGDDQSVATVVCSG